MLQLLDRTLERRTPAQIISLGLAILAAVASLDYVTGVELSFSVFYLPPIVLVTWYSHRKNGYLFCGLSALLWLFIDVSSSHAHTHVLIPVWNTLVRLSFFLITSSLLAEIKNRLAHEKTLSTIDGLTGILNAREFRQRSAALMELASRHAHPIVLGYIDLDNFKKVNDESGHSEGDRVLQAVAKTLATSVRSTDVLGRLGGDEFAVFLHETTEVGAQAIFNRMHQELTQTATGNGWPIGFSIGVAVFATAPDSIDEALKTADSLMYRVKKAGKNNLVFEEQLSLSPSQAFIPSAIKQPQ